MILPLGLGTPAAATGGATPSGGSSAEDMLRPRRQMLCSSLSKLTDRRPLADYPIIIICTQHTGSSYYE